jgi:hypothetical protein
MIQGTRYCHGMDHEVLMSIATHTQEAAVKEVQEWLEEYSNRWESDHSVICG